MDTTEKMELRDENIFPDENVLKGILGDSFPGYQSLIKLFDENHLSHEWRYYKDGKAWLCKVQKKDKTIVWMSAWKGYTKATIYVPEKYIEQVLSLDISDELKEVLRNPIRTGKLRPSTFKLRTAEIPGDFHVVMQFKMSAK